MNTDTLEAIQSDVKAAAEMADWAEKSDITDEQTVMYAQLSMARSLLALARRSVAEYEIGLELVSPPA